MGLVGFMDTIQEASLTMAINELWLMLAGMSGLGLVLLWIMGPIWIAPGHRLYNSGVKM